MVRTEATQSDEPSRESVGKDIAKQIQELRADVAVLAASMHKYGTLSAEEFKSHAQGLSDETIAESMRAAKELRHRVDSIQAQLEGDVRAHPLAWVAGALGLGLLFGLMSSRRD